MSPSELKVAGGTTAPEAAPARKGFAGLPCVLCGKPNGCHLDLENLDRVWCTVCEEEFWISKDVLPLIRDWGKAIEWIGSAPAAE